LVSIYLSDDFHFLNGCHFADAEMSDCWKVDNLFE
jgi:hypothetical protein